MSEANLRITVAVTTQRFFELFTDRWRCETKLLRAAICAEVNTRNVVVTAVVRSLLCDSIALIAINVICGGSLLHSAHFTYSIFRVSTK